MAHVFISPEDINAEDAENIHIFKALKTIYGYKLEAKGCCGNVEYKPDAAFTPRDTRSDVRLFAAYLENQGAKVCGTCVSRLYSDDDN